MIRVPTKTQTWRDIKTNKYQNITYFMLYHTLLIQDRTLWMAIFYLVE